MRSFESQTSGSSLVADVSNQWIIYDVLSAPLRLSLHYSWDFWLAIIVLLAPVYWIVYQLVMRRMKPAVGTIAIVLFLMSLWFVWGIVCLGVQIT